MNVLLLSPYPDEIRAVIGLTDTVMIRDDKVSAEEIKNNKIDFIVSYGYRHILRSAHLQSVNYNAINLHISFLPWNRGAHPNVWSIVEDTPKGVTIHEIDTGIDTGNILAQRRVEFSDHTTLRESFCILHEHLVDLFRETWSGIRADLVTRVPQDPQEGTSHRSQDLERLWALLPNGWNTPLYKVPRLRS